MVGCDGQGNTEKKGVSVPVDRAKNEACTGQSRFNRRELAVGRRPAALIGADVAAFVWRGSQHFSLSRINNPPPFLHSSHTSVISFKMGYGEVDQKAINTIRLLAVSLSLTAIAIYPSIRLRGAVTAC
jgi:hypothetical protein